MPNPSRGSGTGGVWVSPVLTNISVAYMQSARNFIADRVFPIVPVNLQGGRYYKYTKNDWFRTEAELRAPSTESAGSGWRLDNSPTFYCDILAVHKDLDREILANQQAPINMERDATRWVSNQMLLKRDIDWAATYFTTGKWAKDVTGVAAAPAANQFLRWDQAGSDPIEDVALWAIYLAELIACNPQDLMLVIGPEVLNALRNHAGILDRIKYTQRGVVTEDLLSQLFGIGEVMTAWAVKSTAIEGATAAMDFIYGKAALLVYRTPNPSLMEPCGGYIFSWNNVLEGRGNGFGVSMSRHEMPLKKSLRIEGEMAYDMQIVASDAGVYFTTAVS